MGETDQHRSDVEVRQPRENRNSTRSTDEPEEESRCSFFLFDIKKYIFRILEINNNSSMSMVCLKCLMPVVSLRT